MQPLINCDRNDAHRYYRECLVFFNNRPHQYIDKDGNTAVLLDASGKETRVPYSDVRITILPPFYDKNGDYYGHQANRRTSRGIPYPRKSYGDIVALVMNGDVPTYQYPDGSRINKDFRTKVFRGVTTLLYRGDYVGFMQDNVYYVVDQFIQERLAGVSNGISVQVISG